MLKGLSCLLQKYHKDPLPERRWEALFAAALIAISVGLAAPRGWMPTARAEESVVERRRADASRRKELLSKA